MHPIFERKTYFAAYLGAWMVVALLLAGLLRIPEMLGWRDALIIAVPLCLFYAFVCLAPWYVCRHLPLRSTNAAKLLLNHLGGAVLAAAIWVEMARAI
ncbi:MAG TPA: hypothetical protein VK419_13520, partial [Bryobacteraceae bacterium]|nr:hypothetical protein [Bryobacteraceae bacterium]